MLAYCAIKLLIAWTPIVYIICLMITNGGYFIDYITGTQLFTENIGDIIDILG